MTYPDYEMSLKRLCDSLIDGCKVSASDGTVLFTPDGVANYDALWTRDFSYMVEYAGDCITDDQIINAVNFLIRHRRSDGWMPDRVYADGTAVYAAGATGHPIGKANLDNQLFLTFLVYSLYKRLDHHSFYELLSSWLPVLDCSIDLIPTDAQTGLVWNDPQKPHSPYGFTDVVCKTGLLFYESLLYWRANHMLIEILAAYGKESISKYRLRCEAIEKHIGMLFDQEHHLFKSATLDCSQLDIWGNAYLCYIGFPISERLRNEIIDTLINTKNQFIYQGQIRSLYKHEYWEKLLIEINHEEYQNGAYWATASGWVFWCFAQRSKQEAAELFYDVWHYLIYKGSYECINENYQKLPSFVVSATNVYGAFKRLEHDKEFLLSLQEYGNNRVQ